MQPSGREPINRNVAAQRAAQHGPNIVVPVPVYRPAPALVQQVTVVAGPVLAPQPQYQPQPQHFQPQTVVVTQQNARGDQFQRLVTVPGAPNNNPPPVFAKPYGIMPPTQY